MARPGPFAFVQFEFGFLLGPEDGRYLMRAPEGGEPRQVVVLRTLGAVPRSRIGGRRPRATTSAVPEPVPTSRATVVRATPFESTEEAERWLDGVRRRPEAREKEVARACRDLNAALRAYRAAAGDPQARDVAPRQSLVVRLGYGDGEQVSEGRFAAAYELPREPRGKAARRPRIAPAERLTALLSGRERLLACDELVLRARADLDAGRPREASLQARIALEALLSELGDSLTEERRASLERTRELVSEAANAALREDPPPELQEAVSRCVDAMQAALARRGEG